MPSYLSEVVLITLASWLFYRNRIFAISVTPNMFEVTRPSSEYWSWQLSVMDIAEINNYMDINGHTCVYVITHDQKKHQLCPNYSFHEVRFMTR